MKDNWLSGWTRLGPCERTWNKSGLGCKGFSRSIFKDEIIIENSGKSEKKILDVGSGGVWGATLIVKFGESVARKLR